MLHKQTHLASVTSRGVSRGGKCFLKRGISLQSFSEAGACNTQRLFPWPVRAENRSSLVSCERWWSKMTILTKTDSLQTNVPLPSSFAVAMAWSMWNSTENIWYWEEFKHAHVCTLTTVNVEVFHKVTVPSAMLWDSGICSWSQEQEFTLLFYIWHPSKLKRRKLSACPWFWQRAYMSPNTAAVSNWEILILLKILSCPLAFKINMS